MGGPAYAVVVAIGKPSKSVLLLSNFGPGFGAYQSLVLKVKVPFPRFSAYVCFVY